MTPTDTERELQLLSEGAALRGLARTLLGTRADAEDLVQETYAASLASGCQDAGKRPWLLGTLRNLVLLWRRSSARRAAREDVAARASQGAMGDPALIAAQAEAMRNVAAAVHDLEEPFRTVLVLRFWRGLLPEAIARELGVPRNTVRSRLQRGIEKLRARLDASHGDRRAWLLPLVPFAASPRAVPWRDLAGSATTTLSGAIVMTTKTKLGGALVGALVLALAWIAWPSGDAQSGRPSDLAARAVLPAGADPKQRGVVGAAIDEPAREAAAGEAPAATTGTLIVRARYADEPTVAAGVTIHLTRPRSDFRVGLYRVVTDADGVARFEGLSPGTWRVGTPAHATPEVVKAEIAAGSTCECILPLQGGMTVTGVVVDTSGVVVGGAIVEAAFAGIGGVDADRIAVTAADGTFTIRECFVHCLVGARAEGHAASHLHFVEGHRGGTERVHIELRPDGGAVEGLVLGPTGEPVPAAVVRVGNGRTESILSSAQGAPPLPAQVRTDAMGRFRAIGVPAGPQPVQVRTTDLAPWRGTCDVFAGATVAVRIVLAAGIRCTGIVRGEDGEPVPGAEVSVGGNGDFVRLRTHSGSDGTFLLTGMPVGESVVNARKDKVGKATVAIRGQSGETVRCELQLSNGLALRARVLDATGAPISGVEVRVRAEEPGAPWNSFALSGEDGRIVIGGCPPGRTLALLASKPDHVTLQRQAVQPAGPELELPLQRDLEAKACITGRLLRPDGTPAAGEEVEAIRFQTRSEAQMLLSAKAREDGSFVLEAPAGEWLGLVRVKGHPELRFTPGKLEAGAAWDAGVLQLTLGGTLVVRIDGTDAKSDSYTVLDADERAVASIWSPARPLRSDLIAPGDYALLAQGEGFVAQVLPFTIHAGSESALTVTRRPGVRQWIEFDLAPGGERPSYIPFEVRRGATLVALLSAAGKRGAPFRREVWLAPGSYTLSTKEREPLATAAFTVGATESSPVRVVVR
jgi:RNA polymerase sigma factor (sigma-70 family)